VEKQGGTFILDGVVKIDPDEKTLFLKSGNSLSSPAGFADQKAIELSNIFYPNPSSGIVQISNEYNNRFKSFDLYNLIGKKVKAFQNTNTLDISDLKDGYYFVRITDLHNQVFSTRIVKSN